MSEKEAVKTGEPASAVTDKDEKGVSWENRAKEYQRKLEEANQRIQEAESRQETKAPEVTADEAAEAKKQRVYEFVNDPDAYIERRLAEREFKKELPEATRWIKSQDGFTEEDETKVAQIIREHGLSQPSPMLRAKAAWKILQAEKLEKEFSTIKADQKRETTVTRNMPDSSSRSVPTETTPKRADLIRELQKAAAKGDSRREADLINLLEDVRE